MLLKPLAAAPKRGRGIATPRNTHGGVRPIRVKVAAQGLYQMETQSMSSTIGSVAVMIE